ncbi:fatty acyl-CoA hydrolase precursor, medium chain-like [Ptychodera flava]|uniref:fatty acyl-CoA hydrolase precursor, medium chain-like n=1 Tax=Ptychodera flava TaxID=63121 RepID=UPI00396A8AF2
MASNRAHCCVSVFLAVLCLVFSDDPMVEIALGKLVGKSEIFWHPDVNINRTIHIYEGIPYAEPPVGDLRFRPPQSKLGWDGVYRATSIGSACIQYLDPLEELTEAQSEDCLFLNVYVPVTHQTDQLPVMVWVHGGAFIKGSGTCYYNGTALAAIGDVIVVTFNYRLGPLGFLSTGDEHAKGNYGLLDQMAAVQWVHDNIEAFGGDKDTVTLFGNSAGSLSCEYMLLSPLMHGLFHRVIMQSANVFIKGYFSTDTSMQRKTAHGLGKLVGCKRETTEELIQCLRTLPAENFKDFSDITKTKETLENIIGQTLPNIVFPPVADGYFLIENPSRIVEKMAFTKSGLDLMLGNLADEGMYFIALAMPDMWNEPKLTMNKTVYEALMSSLLPGTRMKTSQAVKDALKFMYINWDDADFEDLDYSDALSQQLGDFYFICPADASARAYAKAGFKVYKYHMTHVPSKTLWPVKWIKATHAEDIPFVFGWHFVDGLNWTISKEEVEMTLKVMKYWTNFAKTGNPNLPREDATLIEEEARNDWPLFKVPGLQYKEIALTMSNKRALKAKECAFWNNFIPNLVKNTDPGTKCLADGDEEGKYTKDSNIKQ